MKKNGKLIVSLVSAATVVTVAAVIISGVIGQGHKPHHPTEPNVPTNPSTTVTVPSTGPEDSKPTEPQPTDPKPTDPKPTEPEPSVGPTGPTEPDHMHGYNIQRVEPTCTEQGYTLYTCECGASYKEDYTPALGHSFVTHTAGATCTEAGKETKTCSACGHVETKDIPALGHDIKKTTVEATCDTDGHTLERCSRCDYENVTSVTKAPGHKYGDWVVTKEATCTKEGARERTCSVCGGKEKRTQDALGHDMGKAVVIDATCERDGISTATCTRCGKEVTDTLPATGHDWGDWETTKEMVPNELDGEQKRTCHNCGKVETKVISKEHTRHDWEKRVVKGEGCTQNDKNEWYCTVCGYIGKQEGIPGTAPGHQWTEWKVTKEPGPGVAGEEERHCEVCGFSQTLPIEPLGEDGGKLESYIDPRVETKRALGGYTKYSYGKYIISDKRETWGDYIYIVVNEDDSVTVRFYDKNGGLVEIVLVVMESYDLTCLTINEDGTYELYGFNGFN